jgi:hypothetical protein
MRNRLRPLRAMLNDYRLPQPDTTHTLFEITTQQRHLKVRITRGDLLVARTRSNCAFGRRETERYISILASLIRRSRNPSAERVSHSCRRRTAARTLFYYPAGDLTPIRRIVHYVRYGDTVLCVQTA